MERIQEHRQKLAFVERNRAAGRRITKDVQRNAWQEGREMQGNEEISSVEFKNLRNCIKPRRWNTALLEVNKCDAEGCGNKHLQFKTTQLLFEVVHDV